MNIRQLNFRLQLYGGILILIIITIALSFVLQDQVAKFAPRILRFSMVFENLLSLILVIPFAVFFIWIWEKQGFLKRKIPEEAQQPGFAFRNQAHPGTTTVPDARGIGLIYCVIALFVGYALYIILTLPTEYDSRLPFTGTFLDRIIVGIAIVALVVILYLGWSRDRQRITQWNDPGVSAQQSQEPSRVCYSLMGKIPEQYGTKADLVARINRNLNYILAGNCILFMVFITGWPYLRPQFEANPYYTFVVILAAFAPVFVYSFRYDDQIRVLEDVYPDPSARPWLHVSRWNSTASPLWTPWLTIFIFMVLASQFLLPWQPVFSLPVVTMVTSCIVCLLARV